MESGRRLKPKRESRRKSIRSFQEVKYMFYAGLFKRIIPFVITFIAGLFLASFFVSVAVPDLNMRSERRSHRCRDREQLRIENSELREKMRAMRNQNEELRRSARDWDEAAIMDAVPPIVLDENTPAHPPRKPKHPRVEIVR